MSTERNVSEMARKTFISYKYSDAVQARDAILNAMSNEYEKYYCGEDEESRALTDCSDDTIKRILSDKLYGTSVTILLVSEHMCESDWVKWEIEYSLRRETREGIQSQPNIIIPIIVPTKRINEKWCNWCDSSERQKISKYIGFDLPSRTMMLHDFINGLKEDKDYIDVILAYDEEAYYEKE